MKCVPIESIAGVRVIVPPAASFDTRGDFVKVPTVDGFQPVETFCTISRKNVIRGMHFQTPPHAHAKLIACITGKVADVLVDLRRTSETYLCHSVMVLDAQSPKFVFIPWGIAHGFRSLREDTTMLYQTNTAHTPAHDTGIRWDSFGHDWRCWGTVEPVLSARDREFPTLHGYHSPFPFA